MDGVQPRVQHNWQTIAAAERGMHAVQGSRWPTASQARAGGPLTVLSKMCLQQLA